MAAASSRIRWNRVGRWALICVFAFVIYLYIGPARTWVSTYAEAKRKREEVAQARAQNERLKERKAALSKPGALIRHHGQVVSALSLEIADGRVTEFLSVANPDKLRHLR